MTNKEIYRKTLTFSLRRFWIDVLAFILLAGFAGAGFLVMDKVNDKGLIGLLIGLVIGIIVLIVITRFVSYRYKAGQIAMMTKGVTEGKLPDDVLAEGKAVVKERFTTVAAYFAATAVIKGIFNQIGRGLTKVGNAVGGQTGGNVADAVNSAIQVVVAYLCDCCLGWVFFRREQKAMRATAEGAVLFFKHGKTLVKNLGRIFGMGLASLVLIGGAFFGIFYLIFSQFPAAFERLTAEAAEFAARTETALPAFMNDPGTVLLICAAVAALLLWNTAHSVFVRPFILTGVLRNYLESGIADMPRESDFDALDSKSPKFAKLHAGL